MSIMNLVAKSPIIILHHEWSVPTNAMLKKTAVSNAVARTDAIPGATHQAFCRNLLKIAISVSCESKNAVANAQAIRTGAIAKANGKATKNPT
jgi:hypothetical protein